VLEPGIGTGRIAIPFAQMGYRVVGVDISGEMLARLQQQLQRDTLAQQIVLQRADSTQLPFANNVIDLAVVVHVFYFIPDWRKAVNEIVRVLRKSGSMILMHTGTGTEVPFLNERYKELCAVLQSPIPTIGVKSTNEVVDYCCSLGCTAEWIRDRWQWTTQIQLGKGLEYIKDRAYSFTTFVSDAMHRKVTEQMEAELKSKDGSLETVIDIPNQIYLVIVNTP
jgi:SAM-dependent methyltransferase